MLAKAKSEGHDWVSAVDISRIMRDDYGIRIHWKTILTLLTAQNKLTDRRKRSGRWQFKLMRDGEDHLTKAGASIVVIDPSQAVQAVRSLHDFLSSLSGVVRVCDPYLDAATIEHLDACPANVVIRFLTKNIKDSGTLRRLLAACQTQGRSLEIRVAGSAALHDRYIIDDKLMLILGTSLNGFGKKQCFVVKAGEDVRDIVMIAFDQIWATGTKWP